MSAAVRDRFRRLAYVNEELNHGVECHLLGSVSLDWFAVME